MIGFLMIVAALPMSRSLTSALCPSYRGLCAVSGGTLITSSAFPLVFRPSYGAGIVLLGTIPVKHALHVQGRLLCLCWCWCRFVLWSGCLAFGPGRREHAPNPRACRIFLWLLHRVPHLFAVPVSSTPIVASAFFLLFPWHFSGRRFLHRRSAPRQYGARVGRRTCGCFSRLPTKERLIGAPRLFGERRR